MPDEHDQKETAEIQQDVLPDVNEAEFDEQVDTICRRLREIFVTQGVDAFLSKLEEISIAIGIPPHVVANSMARSRADAARLGVTRGDQQR